MLSAPSEVPRSRFLHRNRVQFSTAGILVLLYAVFLIVKPSVYLSFDIYRSFMISIPF